MSAHSAPWGPVGEAPRAGSDLDARVLVGLLRTMLEVRRFEEEVMRMFARGLVRGSTHLCQGQEAVPVGVCSALRAGDTMTCTYRGHGAVIAMGAPLEGAMAEILGRRTGLCGGKGGSMHLTAVELGALGSFAIVGAHLPISVGAAFSARYRGSDAVTVCFFGDGATNIGAFHEALNLASIWKLPVLFVCENNLYGEYSPIATTTPIEHIAERASSYAMRSESVDGNDVLAVRAAAQAGLARARAGEGPTLLEAKTYRQVGHSRSDPATYRPEGELDAWMARDPISRLRGVLIEWGAATDDELARVEAEATEVVEQAADAALAAEEPAVEELMTDVLA